jgi:hypothetical protein
MLTFSKVYTLHPIHESVYLRFQFVNTNFRVSHMALEYAYIHCWFVYTNLQVRNVHKFLYNLSTCCDYYTSILIESA